MKKCELRREAARPPPTFPNTAKPRECEQQNRTTRRKASQVRPIGCEAECPGCQMRGVSLNRYGWSNEGNMKGCEQCSHPMIHLNALAVRLAAGTANTE
jgi:hypothetical protein